MRATFRSFDKGFFLKVHRYTVVYYIIFNCGSLTKFSLILENLFRRSSSIPQFEFWSGASLILRKLFSRSSFYDVVCFSILASGPYLNATITSGNIFRSSSIDDIIFSCGLLIWMLLLF